MTSGPARLLRSERGSALIISLTLLFVITVLGLALFDLAQLENVAAATSLADYRAFELAQAGIQRGLYELQNGFVNDAFGSESWNDGTPSCVGGCATAQFATLNIANTAVPAQTVASFGTDPGGTFTVELKLLTVGEANNPVSAGYTYPYGVTCLSPSTKANTYPVPATDVCDNVVLLRSTGTVNGPPGYTRSRSIQVLVRAASTSPFQAGLVAGSDGLGDPAIEGQLDIAGSINILGDVNSNPALWLNHSSVQWNNWSALDAQSLAALKPRQMICPPATDCTGGANLVESLEAQINIYGNINNNMVTLDNASTLGAAGSSACYGTGCPGSGRIGKGPLDGVYVADGCPLPCNSLAFTLNGGSTITVDNNNLTKGFRYRPPGAPLTRGDIVSPTWADQTMPVTIAGTSYSSYLAGAGDYFRAHTYNQYTSTAGTSGSPYDLGQYMANSVNLGGGNFGCNGHSNIACWLVDALSNTNDCSGHYFRNCLNDGGTPYHNNDLSQPHSWLDKSGALHNGWICWDHSAHVLSFREGADCTAPFTTPANPMIILWGRQFRVDLAFTYRGAAIWRTGTVTVDDDVNANSVGNPCTECFPDQNLLVIMAGSPMNIAMNSSFNRLMAYLHVNQQVINIQQQMNVVGAMIAQVAICSQNSSHGSCSIGNVANRPRFYQANFYDPRNLPESLFAQSGASGSRWRITPLPNTWLECRLGPTDVLPTTPIGICAYQ